MNNSIVAAQENAIKKALKINGVVYSFTRPQLNEFNEPMRVDSESIFDTVQVKGLFHSAYSGASGGMRVNVNDGAQTVRLNTPAILCEYEQAMQVKFGDIAFISGKKYRVIDVSDYLHMNAISNITMEVIQNGE